MPAATAVATQVSFAVEFGRPATHVVPMARGAGLELTMPLLAGEAREALFPAMAAGPLVEGLRARSSRPSR